MFKPNFRYTDKIVKNLTLISEARGIILNSPLIPKWEVSLRRDALIRSAHSSTAIEGNPLSLDEVSALASGRDIMIRRKDKQEVLNYLEALKKIPEFSGRKPFVSKDILEVHKIVTKDTLDDPRDESVFRNRQVIVGNRITGEVVFMPPPTEQVPKLTDDFLGWFNAPEINEIDPVIEAGITHYEIVRIHPFIDGNGRTARIMASIVLFKRGFDVKRFFALDDYYDHDRRAYYSALKTVDPKSRDITAWLEYFTNGVAVSIEAVNKKVIGLSKNIKLLKEKGQIALTDRQMKIVERIIQENRITVGDIAKMFEITRQAALKEMNKLVDSGVVKLKGKGRGAYYILV
ncbi:MAG: Fic family protein [Nitrospinae bacterium]|nr:Fic family protein [Nitrospinota bacterium]